MVRLFTFLLLCMLPLIGIAGSSLNLSLDRDKQQLGWAFTAEIIASGIDKELSGIDLSPLEKDFGVIVKELSGSSGNIDTASQQRLGIELYPRRTGALQIPELIFSGIPSKPIDVEVLQAENSSGPIKLEYQLSTTQPWQRQQVLLTIDVNTPDRFARLETVSVQHSDNEVRRIPASKETLDASTRMETGWVIFPMQSGQQTVSLPPVLYHLQGVVERRFYLPGIQLNIKPLPDYIPPLMPVGKVLVDTFIDSDGPLTTGETYNWNIRIYSPALLSHLLPPVLRQISSDNNINYLPAKTWRVENITTHGSHGEALYTIPFQPLSTGKLTLPDLRIQYFDPELGRVAIAEHSPLHIWSIAGYWQLLFGVALLLFSIYLVKTIWKFYLQLREQHRLTGKAIRHITDATTSLHLRQALPLISRAENWPENMSLNAWCECWNKHYSPSADAIVQELSYACYAKTKDNVISIKNDLLNIINNRKSNRRRLFTFGM